MKRDTKVYPIVISKTKEGFIVDLPDFKSCTQGKDYVDSILMARDAIGLLGITLQDSGKKLPDPTPIENIQCGQSDIKTVVDIDFYEYRLRKDLKFAKKYVKKNCTIAKWLEFEADKYEVNYSKVLQNALIQELGLQDKADYYS